jgi:hypothetical protein
MLRIGKTKGKDEREVMTVSSATYVPYREGSSIIGARDLPPKSMGFVPM